MKASSKRLSTALRQGMPLLAAAALAAGAAAQTVYRCGEDGRTYQNSPCTGGRPVDVADPRSDEQRRAAKETAAADARLADRLQRERRAEEAALARRNALAAVVPAAPPAAASAPSYVRSVRRPPHGRMRYSGDGTPVPPVYRVPTPPKDAKGPAKGR